MSPATTVLLCDDSRALRMIISRQLAQHGFQVIGEADNGRAAVQQYQALKPDVVLLDLVMPEIDGKRALKRMLELDPDARVVILSSLGARNDIEECLQAGAKSYLQKPIDPEAMLRVLRETVA